MTPDEIYRQIGENIRRYRKGRRTQAQLGAEIGISRASLANIEAGRQQVLVHHLYAIAAALDLESPAALMPELAATHHPVTDTLAVPLPQQGLSNKQRQEVLRLMGGVLSNNKDNKLKDDA